MLFIQFGLVQKGEQLGITLILLSDQVELLLSVVTLRIDTLDTLRKIVPLRDLKCAQLVQLQSEFQIFNRDKSLT